MNSITITDVHKINGQLIINPDGESQSVPEQPGNRYYDLIVKWVNEGNEISVIEPTLTKQQSIDAINEAAGEARKKIMLAFVSPGFGTIDEYNNTALEVKKWRDAGSPADDVPLAITAWSTPKQITDEEAAAELEAQEAFLRAKLDEVRALRLAGTVETANAESEWENVAQPHIDALRNYSPQ